MMVKQSVFLGVLLAVCLTFSAVHADQASDRLYSQADSLYRAGQYSQAAELFQQAAEKGSRGERAEYQFLAAKALFRAGNLTAAQSTFADLLHNHPAPYIEAASHFYLGNIAFEDGRKVEAGHEYLDAWRSDYSDTRRDIYIQSLRPLLEYHLSLDDAERLYNTAGDRDLQRALFCSLAERYHNEGKCRQLLDRIDDYLARNADSPCAERLAQLQRFCRLGLMSSARVAILAPQEGPLATYGENMVNGARMAFDDYHSRTGAEIDLVIKNTKGTTVGAAIAAGELETEPISAILGPLTSAEVPAVVAKAGCVGIPVISPTASAAELTAIDDNFIQVTPSLPKQIKELANFAAHDLQIDSVALIYPDDIDGREAANNFLDVARREGVNVFFSRSFSPAAADFRDVLMDLKVMLLPDKFDSALYIDKYGDTLETEAVTMTVPAICIPATQAQLELIIPQVNFYKIQTTFLGGDTWGSRRILDMSELKTREVYFTDNFFVLPTDRDYNYFYNRYEQRFGQAPDDVAARSYDAARLLTEAIGLNGPSPEAVMSYLDNAKLETALAGRIEIGPDRENSAVHVYHALAGTVERVK